MNKYALYALALLLQFVFMGSVSAHYVGALSGCFICGAPSDQQLANGGKIDAATGSLAQPTLVSHVGPASIDLALAYRSENANGDNVILDTGLGYGWTHGYNLFLFAQSTSLFKMDGTGSAIRYVRSGGGAPGSGTLARYEATGGYFETLQLNADGSYTLTSKRDGTVERYTKVTGTPFSIGSGPVYRLVSSTDRNGLTTSMTYANGDLTAITDPFQHSLSLIYDAGHHLIRVVDAMGHQTVLGYDGTAANRKLLSVQDPDGNTERYTYDYTNNLTLLQDKDGRRYTYSYANGKVYKVVDQSGQTLFSMTNPVGWATNDTVLAASQMRVYQVNSSTNTMTTSKTDGLGRQWLYEYDANGFTRSVTAPDGATTRYTYDPITLRLATQTDANGHTTAYQYDSIGNLLKQTDALGHQTVNAYANAACADKVTSTTYPNGSTTTYEYDAHCNRTKETRDAGGLNLVSAWTYDSQGHVLTATDPNGHVAIYQYNSAGEKIQATDAESHTTQYQYNAISLLNKTIDANNHATVYDYDGMNRLKTETDPLGYATKHYYDGSGNRIKTEKQVSKAPDIFQTTAYQYDSRNRLIQEIRDPAGLNLITQYAYDNNNNRITLTDPRGKTTQYAYDVQNRLNKITDALGNITQTQYDPVGNRIQATDANGNRSCSQYDALNRVTAQTRKMDASACGTSSSNDIVTRNVYDTGTTFACAPDSGSPSCSGPMPGSGNPAYSIDPQGKYSYFKYDKTDRRWITIRKVTDTADTCDGNDWCQYSLYDAASNTTARIDANGNRISTTYYANNWLHTETVDPGGLNLTTTTTYDGVGNAVTVTNPRGDVITNIYDDKNQLVMVVDSIGKVAEYQYDGIGNRIVARDGNQGDTNPATADVAPQTQYAYDAVNRLIQVTDPLGNSSVNAYDSDGNLVKTTDRESHVSCHYYDDINRRTRTAQLMGGSDCSTLPSTALWTDTYYDGVGNVTRLITAKQSSSPAACAAASPPADCETTSYQYDPANRLVLETYADATTRAFQYDKAGNLAQRTDQLGQVTQYGYNDLYYLLLRDYQDPAEPDDSFLYDTGGRMTRAERAAWVVTYDGYDAANRVLQTTQDATGSPMLVQYAYNTAAGTRDVTYPGGRACHEQKDLRERLGQNACDSFEATYAYDLGNRVQTRAYNNGVTTHYSYNANNWITALTHTNGGTVADFGYAYDKEGNKQYENKAHDPAKSEAYAYDEVYRLIDYKVGSLVGSTVPLPTTQTQYNLDKVGNWDQFTQDNDGAGPGVPIVYQNTPNQMNEYDDLSTNGPGEIPDDLGIPNNFKDNTATPAPDGENWAHDKNGNRREDGKRFYVYDDENRLIRVTRKTDSVATAYRYDALSHRVSKTVGVGLSPVTTRYAYDDARIVEEQDGAAATLATYVYGNYIDEVLNMQRTGADYYYHQNALWSVIAVTNASATVMERYAYTDYGCPSVIHSAIGNPWMFTGRQWDEESGVYFYRARYYDCESGRFLQRDREGNPNTTNLYEYSGNSPVRWTDPSGLYKCAPKLITGTPDIVTIYSGGNWRKSLLSWGKKAVNNDSFEMLAHGTAHVYYVFWYDTDSDEIKANGIIGCECIKKTCCKITVSEKEGSVWSRTKGVISQALQATVNYRGDDEVDVGFRAGAANQGGDAIGAGIGSAKVNLSFPSTGMAAVVSLGSAKWRCEK